MSRAKEYVLVHGACHGGWCWETVAERLAAKGHRVVALDLPGHGRRASEHASASVENYARAVARGAGESPRVPLPHGDCRDALPHPQGRDRLRAVEEVRQGAGARALHYGGMPVVVDALNVFKEVLVERGEWKE